MLVSDVTLSPLNGEFELSARLGGLRIWHRVPEGHTVACRADPFLIAALMGAMAKGETLEVAPDSPVSPRLLRSMDQIQDILHVWNPALTKIDIRATEAAPPAGKDGVAAFFSGGVDGSYTLVKHLNEITHLIFVHGLEIPLANESLFQSSLEHNRKIAAHFGKPLIPVKTNMREFGAAHRLVNFLYQGAILGSVAQVLGFSRTFIGASVTYRYLVPVGSHPLLDPLWSTEACQLIHDGAEARRCEKVARIAKYPEILNSLRVCLANTENYNCGRCEKCLRTMLTLRLLGASSLAFPPLNAVARTRWLLIPGLRERVFLEENYELARKVADRPAQRALRACLRRHTAMKLLDDLDRGFLGGRMRRLVRRLQGRKGPPGIGVEAYY